MRGGVFFYEQSRSRARPIPAVQRSASAVSAYTSLSLLTLSRHFQHPEHSDMPFVVDAKLVEFRVAVLRARPSVLRASVEAEAADEHELLL